MADIVIKYDNTDKDREAFVNLMLSKNPDKPAASIRSRAESLYTNKVTALAKTVSSASITYNSKTGSVVSSDVRDANGNEVKANTNGTTTVSNNGSSTIKTSPATTSITAPTNASSDQLNYTPGVSTSAIDEANLTNIASNVGLKGATALNVGISASDAANIVKDASGAVSKDAIDEANTTSKTDPVNSSKSSEIDPKSDTQGKEDLSAAAANVEGSSYTDPKTDIFHTDVKVYLEGVQVPHSQCSVSYGIGSPPSCTIVIPANNFLRELPATTKIHIVHKDLLPDENGDYKDRLLFDGELASYSYSIDPSGANIAIHGIHCCAYLTFMQLMCQEVREYLTDPSWQTLGDSVCMLKSKFSSLQVCLMGAILKSKKSNIKTMADLVYIMLNYLINESYEYSRGGVKTSSASAWYHNKLGDVEGAYKILQRIYGVTEAGKSAGKLGDYTQGWKGALTGSASSSPYGSDVAGSGNITVNASTRNIYDLIKQYTGLNDAAVCGIMGNIQGESSFNLACVGDNGTSFGLCQWHNERGDAMKAMCTGDWATDAEGQIKYLAKELKEGGYMDFLLAITNDEDGVAKATEYFVYKFERPADQAGQTQVRTPYALSFWKRYGKGGTAAPGDQVKTIRFSHSDQRIYAYNAEEKLINSWECRDAFEEGFNEQGQARERLPIGTYKGRTNDGINAEYLDKTMSSYGTFYITTGDPRGRDIHGGGSNRSIIPDPFAPYQGWLPTYGCLRMQNADGEELTALILASSGVTCEVEG